MKNIFFQAALLASALQGSAGLAIAEEPTDNSQIVAKANAAAIEAIQQATNEIQMNLEVIKEIEANTEADATQEDCAELGGTDSDALEYDANSQERSIWKHALWVETSFIPRHDCLAKQGKLGEATGKKTVYVGLDTYTVDCYENKQGKCQGHATGKSAKVSDASFYFDDGNVLK